MATKIEGTYDDGTVVVSFEGHLIEVTVTASGDVAHDWVEETYHIRRRRSRSRRHPSRVAVGLDAKWQQPRSRRHPSPVAVLSLCADRRCLVFQILRGDRVPRALSAFLADSRRFTFVGTGAAACAAKLSDEHRLEVAEPVELADLAADALGRNDLRGEDLPRLAREVMGVQMETPPQRGRDAEWKARTLTDGQLKHACAYAFAAMVVASRLSDDGEWRDVVP
ncbi:hypothetical protein ACP4OV_024617 [Aristida adscensionis]